MPLIFDHSLLQCQPTEKVEFSGDNMNGGRRLYGVNPLRPREDWQPRVPFRQANDAEATKLADAAPPEFARLYVASRLMKQRAFDVSQLSIEAIDFMTLRITPPALFGTPVEFGDELETILRSAVHDRKSGPAFLSPRGKVWQRSQINKTAKRARTAAGITGDVVV